MSHITRYLLFLAIGGAAGAGGLALGAFLASGNNGWTNVILYSAAGALGAPLTAVSWATRRFRRRMLCAGGALLLGLLSSMGILLELTAEYSSITRAVGQVPLAVAGWFVIWVAWIATALARLILFEPPRTRNRLSSRRGDGGA
jgi:hypothetical protein